MKVVNWSTPAGIAAGPQLETGNRPSNDREGSVAD
jgi:hypothetical protein